MPNSGMSVLDALSRKMVVAPYVQTAMLSPSWPENFTVDDPYFHDSHTDDYFHPSTHSLYGERAVYFMLHPEHRGALREKPTYDRLMTPLMGSVMHAVIQQNLVHQGFVEPEDVEIALINEEHHWKGHADLDFDGLLVDIKTSNSMSFNNLSSPRDSWAHQLNPYMDAMGRDTSIVLVVEMGMPWRMKEFTVPLNTKLRDGIYQKWANVTAAIKADTPPETCCLPEHSRFCPIDCGGKIPPR